MLRTALFRQTQRLARTQVGFKRILSAGTVAGRHQFLRGYATNEVEYEIDIITLKKTPKAPKTPPRPPQKSPEQVTKDAVKFKTVVDEKCLDPVIVEKTINQINNSFDAELNDFVLRYSNELNVFVKFVQQSYGYKIKGLNQLTSTETLNSLYIFKDYYLKNKIGSINKYNYISYNYMFDNFLKLTKKHRNLPKLIHYLLLVNTHGIQLLTLGIDAYQAEVLYLCNHMDLNSLNWHSERWKEELNWLISAVESKSPDDFDSPSEYYESMVDQVRMMRLRNILEQVAGISLADLHFLMTNDHFIKICDAVASSRIAKPLNLCFMKFLLMQNDLSPCECLAQLKYMMTIRKDLPSQMEGMCNELLVSLFEGRGNHYSEMPLDFAFTKFKISDNLMENYEFSLIFHNKLYTFVDELKVLNAMGIDLTDKSLVKAVNELEFDNRILKDRFAQLSTNLSSFFDSLVNDKTGSLNRLIERKNWSDWCQENHNSKVPRMLIDYSNLSDYPYKSISVDTELAHVLPQLYEFSSSNKVDLSVIRLNYLLDLFQDDFQVEEAIRKLYLSNGDVAVENVQKLVDDYQHLQFNLARFDLAAIRNTENKPFKSFDEIQLRKHFGYYADLIKTPLILDNLQELYHNSNHPEFKSFVDPFEKLKDFKYELEILKVDELQDSFTNLESSVILSVLDKRIKEILSNLNPNPSSRLNFRSIDKFIDLHKVLTACFKEDPKNTAALDGLIAYRQIPDNFNLHEYADILSRISKGVRFSSMSMGQVLKASSGLVESTPESLIFDYARYVKLDAKLRKLFKMNGGYTEVLDTVCLSDSKFHEFEQMKQQKKHQQVEYVQIPENAYIHEFSDELAALRADRFPKGFKTASSSKVLEVLDNDINGFLADQVLPDHYITSDTISSYLKLSNNLEKLFKINGNNTEVLDAVIQSDNVFKELEKKTQSKSESKSVYRQLPDDFRLHEFTSEIQQLKTLLESSAYYGHPIHFATINHTEVIDILEFMGEEPSFILRKRQNFKKLAKNLKVLFKYNGYNTSILDNVLVSEEVFNDVSGRVGMTTKDELKSFLKDYQQESKEFFDATKMIKFDLIDFHDLSKAELLSKVSKFLHDIKSSSPYKYPSFRYYTERLLELYDRDPINLAVIFQARNIPMEDLNVKQIREEVSSFMKKLSSHRDLYVEEESSAETEQVRESVEVPVTKFNMDEFRNSESASSPKYTRGTEKFNIKEDSLDDSELFVRNQIFHQLEKKDAQEATEVDELMKLSAEEIRANYHNSRKLNEANLQKYLENINQQKKQKDEEAFRQTKAYEWSKAKSTSNRSLESNNFFDSAAEGVAGQSLLLSSDGSHKLCSKNPLIEENYRNVIKTLEKFDEIELNEMARAIDALQRRSWKLVGGDSAAGVKQLVFRKEGNRKGAFQKVKNIFAVTGATFLALVGLNYLLDEPTKEKAQEVVQERVLEPAAEIVEEVKEEVRSPIEAMIHENTEIKKEKQSGWFWK